MRCTSHGLATGPDGLCVRCRREQEDAKADAHAEARAPLRRTGALLGGALVASGVLLVIFAIAERRPRRVDPTTLPRASSPAPVPSPALTASATLSALAPAQVNADPAPRSGAKSATASPLDRAARDVNVVFYCNPSSADCARARQWMLDRGLTYTEKDVDVDPAAARAASAIGGGGIPAFSVDGQPIPGFDPDRLANAVRYAAARRLQR